MPPAKKPSRKPTKKTAKKRTLTTAHKKALAEGRTMSATVDRYLAALNIPKKRGRRISPAMLEQRLTAARTQAKSASGLEKLTAAQAVRDLQARLAQAKTTDSADITTLERDFVKVAKRFGEQRRISYGAFRDAGVSAVVLKKAGIARTRG